MGRGGRLGRSAAADGIEFVAPRLGLFGTGYDVEVSGGEVGPASFGDEPPTHRWGTAMAVLAVVGLVAVGVVAASPWDDTAAPSPTTVPTPSTTPRTTSPATEPPQTTTAGTLPPGVTDAPTGYLLDAADVPAGYELNWAERPSRRVPSDRPGYIRLWATPNATRAQGAWLALEVVRADRSGWRMLPMGSAARVAVGDAVGTTAVDEDGVVSLQWPLDDTHDGRFTAHDWTVDQLVGLALTTSLDDATQPVFADPSFLDGYQAVIAGPGLGWGLATELLDRSRATVHWIGPDGTFLSVITLTADPGYDKSLYDFVLAPISGEPFTGPKTFWAVGDLTLTVGRLDGLDGTTVKWTVGDATVLLTADLPVTDLVDLATKVHIGTADEWRTLQREARDAATDQGAAEDWMMGPPIASGATDAGLTWDVSVSTDGSNVSVQLGSATGGIWRWYVALDQTQTQIQLATTPDAVYAVAVLSSGSGATTFDVAGPWGERSEPFITITDGATQLLVAVLEITEFGPFTVSALDANGQVVTSATVGAPPA